MMNVIIDKKGFDKLILLGDILTYGVNIHEVLDLVANRVSKNNTYLIRGNHDQLYDELLNSKYSDYYENLPALFVSHPFLGFQLFFPFDFPFSLQSN